MKPINSSSIDLRLAAYAAAGVALAAPAMSSTARADIVYSGPLTLAVPQTFAGIYLNVVTGATATSGGSLPGYDFSVGGTTLLNFYASTFTAPGAGVAGMGGTAMAFAPGTTISSSLTYLTGPIAGNNFRTTGTEFAGIKFTNETTNAINYGWVQLGTVGAGGTPATILGYAYENTGGSILAGQTAAVPEPATTAALGLGALALGAAGVRRWRRNQAA